MNDNTIIRIRVPKHLYESVKRELTLLEGKGNYGMPGSTTVKEKKTSDSKPKAASERPKNTSAPKKANAPQKATGAMYDEETSKLGAGVSETKKTPKDGHKKMGLEELKALAEMLKGHIAEMEGEDKKKEKVEEEKEEEGEEKKDLKEWDPNEPDEPEEFDPQDYELGYARQGGRSLSRRDVRRISTGRYSDDEIAAAQQADAVRMGRIPAPKQTPRREY